MSGIKHVDFMNRSIILIDLEGSASDFEVIDIGEKAKKLVRLSARNELLVVYNLAGVRMTSELMSNLKNLMEHAVLVSRRVMYGIDPSYGELLRQVTRHLGIDARTRFADDYVKALQLITDDAEWKERRGPATGGSWNGPDRRADPSARPGMPEFPSGTDKAKPRGN